MEKRGRCRCGSLLLFRPTPQGYKTRCTACNAIVRLREEEPSKPPPLPVDLTPPDLSMLETHESSAPPALAEIPAYRDPTPAPSWFARLGWWLVPLGVAAVLLLLIAFALLFR